jgi:hypothetical protein
MKKSIFKVIIQIAIIGIFYQIFGQTSGDSKESLSVIYDQIMKTLSIDMKAKIDSASNDVIIKQQLQNKQNAIRLNQTDPTRQRLEMNAYLNTLPEDVRIRIEKAINEINNTSQNREIQFKEYRKRQFR